MLFFFFFFFFFFFCKLRQTYFRQGVLRNKNYSLFLECTFDMNNCYTDVLVFVEKTNKIKYNKVNQ